MQFLGQLQFFGPCGTPKSMELLKLTHSTLQLDELLELFEGKQATGRGFMICGFIVKPIGRGFEKKPLDFVLRHVKAC